MNFVWSSDGIQVGSISMNRWDGMQMWTSGYGLDNRSKNGNLTFFQWEATALSIGWYVVITKPNGVAGHYQGDTFNLPLEIAVAAKRLL